MKTTTVVAFDDTVVMDRDPAPEGVVEFAMPWRGVVKLPGGGPGGDAPDRAIELELWPDGRALFALLAGEEPQAMLRAVSPVIRYTLYDGTLTDLATNTLDTSFMRETGSGIVSPDGTVELETGTQLAAGAHG